MEPSILYEDEQLVVVNKPAGMIVYPDGVHEYPALSHWLEKRYGEGNFHFVHRIDRETSGVLIIAKDAKTHEFLKEQFKNREVQKTYRAFVMGTLKEERGMINKPIGSSRGGAGPRSARAPYGTEREALTIYRMIKAAPGATYVEVFPKTGRTHQIRVHFAAIGHPIVADVLYGVGRPSTLGFARLALHAMAIRFIHPNGKEVAFEAPLPADFIEAEKELYTTK